MSSISNVYSKYVYINYPSWYVIFLPDLSRTSKSNIINSSRSFYILYLHYTTKQHKQLMIYLWTSLWLIHQLIHQLYTFKSFELHFQLHPNHILHLQTSSNDIRHPHTHNNAQTTPLMPPLTTPIYSEWPFGPFICKVAPYMQGVSVSASVHTLAAVAVERLKFKFLVNHHCHVDV